MLGLGIGGFAVLMFGAADADLETSGSVAGRAGNLGVSGKRLVGRLKLGTAGGCRNSLRDTDGFGGVKLGGLELACLAVALDADGLGRSRLGLLVGS